ncbi:MAG: tetratricopeptide repeat protein [Methanomicrobium sp.]|nr:tetratricopeptide repeat protein [Methanomicrobium sp.]
MAEITVLRYFESEGGYLLPAEYTISFDSATDADLNGVFSSYRALYAEAEDKTVNVRVPEDPALVHSIYMEICEMMEWAYGIDGSVVFAGCGSKDSGFFDSVPDITIPGVTDTPKETETPAASESVEASEETEEAPAADIPDLADEDGVIDVTESVIITDSGENKETETVAEEAEADSDIAGEDNAEDIPVVEVADEDLLSLADENEEEAIAEVESEPAAAADSDADTGHLPDTGLGDLDDLGDDLIADLNSTDIADNETDAAEAEAELEGDFLSLEDEEETEIPAEITNPEVPTAEAEAAGNEVSSAGLPEDFSVDEAFAEEEPLTLSIDEEFTDGESEEITVDGEIAAEESRGSDELPLSDSGDIPAAEGEIDFDFTGMGPESIVTADAGDAADGDTGTGSLDAGEVIDLDTLDTNEVLAADTAEELSLDIDIDADEEINPENEEISAETASDAKEEGPVDDGSADIDFNSLDDIGSLTSCDAETEIFDEMPEDLGEDGADTGVPDSDAADASGDAADLIPEPEPAPASESGSVPDFGDEFSSEDNALLASILAGETDPSVAGSAAPTIKAEDLIGDTAAAAGEDVTETAAGSAPEIAEPETEEPPAPPAPPAPPEPEVPQPDPDSEEGLLAAAAQLCANGEYTRAAVKYTQALELNPGNTDTLISRAITYSNSGKWQQAVADFESAGGIDALSPKNLVRLADAYKGCKDADKALMVYEKLSALMPGNQDVFIHRFLILKEFKRYEEAIFLLSQMRQGDPTNTNLIYETAGIHEILGDNEGILEDYNAILEIDESQIEIWVKKAVLLVKLERLDEALACYDHLVSCKPDNAGLWYSKGLVQMSIKDYEGAYHSLDVALALSPSDADAIHAKARVMTELHNYDGALELYGKLIRDGNVTDAVYLEIAGVQKKMGLYDEAIKSYSHYLTVAPNDPEGLRGRGDCYAKLEMFSQAATDYRHLLNAEPDNGEILSSLASIYESLGRFDEGLNVCEKILAISPKSEEALTAKMRCLKGLNRTADAVKVYDDLIALNPRAELYAEKGALLASAERFDEAVLAYEDSIALNSASRVTILDLIDLLTDLNRYAESINYYDMLIRLAPEETDLLLSKGIAQVNAGLYTQAIETFDEVIAAKPQDPLPVFRKGMVLLRLKRMDDAMRCYLKSLELDPSYGNNWLKMGVYATTFMDQDLLKGPSAEESSERPAPAAKPRKKAKAVAEPEEIADDDTYEDDAVDDGGREVSREEPRRRVKPEAAPKAEDADAYATAEPEQAPAPVAEKPGPVKKPTAADLKNPAYLYEKGVALTKAGYYPAALKCFERAVELDSENPSYHFSLGVVYGKLQDYKKALECFDTVLYLSPGHEGAIKGRLMALKRK